MCVDYVLDDVFIAAVCQLHLLIAILMLRVCFCCFECCLSCVVCVPVCLFVVVVLFAVCVCFVLYPLRFVFVIVLC